MNVSAKMAYLARMTTDRLLGRHLACPNCDAADHIVVDRKYLVTELRRCRSCRLLFRAPTDSSTFNQSFYNDGYEQGFTTELPDDATLRRWMDSCFAGTPKDYAPIVDFLNVLGIAPPARIFDFGCSWGYGSWQMARAGYDVWASEISRPRSQFAASKLGVRLVDPDRMTEFQGSFDLFFSSHVLEHVPRIADVHAACCIETGFFWHSRQTALFIAVRLIRFGAAIGGAFIRTSSTRSSTRLPSRMCRSWCCRGTRAPGFHPRSSCRRSALSLARWRVTSSSPWRAQELGSHEDRRGPTRRTQALRGTADLSSCGDAAAPVHGQLLRQQTMDPQAPARAAELRPAAWCARSLDGS
jgi:hypothetical protein